MKALAAMGRTSDAPRCAEASRDAWAVTRQSTVCARNHPLSQVRDRREIVAAGLT